MQPKFTLTSLGSICMKVVAMAMIFVFSIQFSYGQTPDAKAAIKAQVKFQSELRSRLNAKLQARQVAPAYVNNDAGLPNAAVLKPSRTAKTEAVCQTFTGSLAAGDATMANRLTRPGVNSSSCAANPAFPGPFALNVFVDTYTYQNTTGLPQCATIALSTTDVTNANIQFGVWNGSVNTANLATNYLSDPGSSTGTPAAPLSIQITLAANQIIALAVWSANDASTAAGTASNYTLTIDFPVCSSAPCSGTPTPGNTIASVATVCPAISFTLSLQNNTTGSGVTYQWQTSATNAPGSYINAPGASTGSTYTTTQSAATWYRCQVTCSGNTGTSNPVQVLSTPPSNCYCAAGSGDVTFEKISNVVFNTINNPSTSPAGYENFLNISTTVVKGQTVPIVVSISNAFTTDQVVAWIDFNQNGSFSDPGELVYTSSPGVGPHSGTVTIAPGALTGSTRLRIRMWDSGFENNPGPCGNSTFGQVEDYTVNIQPCIPGVWSTHPSSTSITCGGSNTFTVAAAGSALNFTWEYQRPTDNYWTPIVNGNDPNGGTYAGATTASLTLTNATVAMNGYKYRAVMTGACTGVDVSNAATLTVNPLVATVTPNPANICVGSVQALTITNTASTPVTTTFSSGAISIPVPDNNVAGINHSIPVSGITGTVTGVSVKFTIANHTFPSDLVVALKAPNGNTLNLDYHISGTGAAPGGGGLGMVNTVISSAANLPALSTSSNPFTSTFKPDAQTAVNPLFGTPPAATGFATNMVNSYSGLTSTPNGNWTLVVFDGFGGDVGTLTGWSIDITSVVPVPATGVWTGNLATMWNNAAANSPYVAGTPQTTIYVNPATTQNYSVVVTTALCTTAPTVVPVNVYTPVSGVTGPVNTSVCAGSSTTLSVTAAGGPLTYQWQVSSDNGLTYTNIAGATGATLALNNVLQTMNNYKYRVNLASSPCNAATSAVAVLTVNPLPVVTLTATDLNLVPGGTSTITASSVPAALNATSYTWTLNGATIAGATGSSVVANIDKLGTYVATVTDVNGCKNTSSIQIGTEAQDRLWIYPNPSPDGKFQVRLYHRGELSERRILRVYTAQGDLVRRYEFNQYNTNSRYQEMDVDLSKFGPGSYLVTVENKYAKNIAAGIVVIQH